MIEELRREFEDLLLKTDFQLDENLVRAAVRQYLKARVRKLAADADPKKHAALLKRKREQNARYREEGYSLTRGRDTVLKPGRRTGPNPKPKTPATAVPKRRGRPPKKATKKRREVIEKVAKRRGRPPKQRPLYQKAKQLPPAKGLPLPKDKPYEVVWNGGELLPKRERAAEETY